jgi:membrane-bound lytic murein transglycosylase MltF
MIRGSHMMTTKVWCALLVALTVTACSGRKETPTSTAASSSPGAGAAQPATGQTEEDDTPAAEIELPPDLRSIVLQPFTADFDEMVKRRLIRVGVPFNRTFYFVDKGVQRGLAYEYIKLYEDDLNKRLKTGNLKVHLVLIPLRRDQLLPALTAGKVDVVVAQMTITPERQQAVDFTIPTRRDVNEVIVTGPAATHISTVDDLSGEEVFVRKSSSYYQSLLELNKRFAQQSKPPVDIQEVNESLEDDDLLEMVNAGLLPATLVDNYFADFWKQVFKDLTVHETIALRTGGNLGVAIRKNSQKLAEDLNAFIGKYGLNSAMGQILNKRYLQSTKYARNARSDEERKKFQAMVALFKQYGEQYDFDYLMMAAQGYQESALDQNARSQVGAIGVMQLMPETGREQKVGDVSQLEPNIHAGVKYMRFMRDQYFKDEPMTDVNKALFTFASYNAGPGKIRQLRRETERRGLDPNVWFGNVEQIASERIGRETVTYVSNIYKYYLAYRLLTDEAARRHDAKSALTRGTK